MKFVLESENTKQEGQPGTVSLLFESVGLSSGYQVMQCIIAFPNIPAKQYRHIGYWCLSAVVKKATERVDALPGHPETLFGRESAKIQRTIGFQCAEGVYK